MPRPKKGKKTGELLQKLLQQKGFTPYVLSQKTGLGRDHISKIINGYVSSPTQATLEKIAKALQMSLGELVSVLAQSPSDEEELTPNPSFVEREDVIAHHTPLLATSTDPNFVGREGAIAQLTSLVNQGAKIITICAPGGVGKTTLAWQYLQSQGFDKILEIWMAKEIQNINSIESEVERWLQQNFGEEPGRDFGVNVERLRQKLRDPNQRIGILIDNLEPALDRNGRFIETRRAYVDLLRVLADPGARSLALITSRECLCEPSIEIRDYRLEGLDEASWQEFFDSHSIQINLPALAEMHHAYGGNAKAMQILSSAIKIDFDGDLAIFWKENQADLLLNPTLENLVVEQFNRLQIIYPEAYRLLCRLGCFRYQDVSTVSLDGILCLLWDAAETRKRRVIRDLQARALVEIEDFKYWLHPVIRAEAINRLLVSQDWKIANQKAAEFWTKKVEFVHDSGDAIQAFEAFHQYLQINQLDLASDVILTERGPKWEQRKEALGRAFYRLGLLQPMISAINKVIGNIDDGYKLSEFYNILGDLSWIKGDLKKAIEFHTLSKEASENYLALNCFIKNDLRCRAKNLTITSLFNIGLCKIDLWEIEEAINFFEKVKLDSKDFEIIPAAKFSAYICLAFLNSLYTQKTYKDKSYYFIERAWENFSPCQLSAWGRGYSLLFLGLAYKNLGEFRKALQIYNSAITFANESYYTQVKAKALIGLSEIDRIKLNFQESILKHLESIDLIRTVGAKCDLAEAYFQFGLTYQAMGEVKQGLEYRDKAIKLFEEMEAPRQVERVRLAFGQAG